MSMDLAEIADALVATLTAANITAKRWSGSSGEVRANSVLVVPPSIDLEPLGEGFRVSGTQWPLILYAGNGRGEVTDQADFDLLEKVLDALTDDVTLGGVVVCATPIVADRPSIVSIGAEGAKRSLMRRDITIRIDH